MVSVLGQRCHRAGTQCCHTVSPHSVATQCCHIVSPHSVATCSCRTHRRLSQPVWVCTHRSFDGLANLKSPVMMDTLATVAEGLLEGKNYLPDALVPACRWKLGDGRLLSSSVRQGGFPVKRPCNRSRTCPEFQLFATGHSASPNPTGGAEGFRTETIWSIQSGPPARFRHTCLCLGPACLAGQGGS